MTEKIKLEETPATLENPESVTENQELQQEENIVISEEAKRELDEEERDIRFRQSETAQIIRDAQARKGKELEKLDSGTTYNVASSQKPKSGVRNKIMAGAITLASLFGFGGKAKAEGDPSDSLGKKPTTEKVYTDSIQKSTPSSKSYEIKVDNETKGHIKIESHVVVPQKDTTKEAVIYYFSDDGKSKNSLGEIMLLMKEKGFYPGDRELLNNIYEENKNNPEFARKMKWVLAPTPEGDADDTRSQEGHYITNKGKTSYVIPEHAVFPTINPRGLGRFEISEGFNSGEYGILFNKKVEKVSESQNSDLATK